MDIEHPDITQALLTGYPLDNQPEPIYCCECGRELDGEIYEDFLHEFLCEKCLLMLHKKEW